MENHDARNDTVRTGRLSWMAWSLVVLLGAVMVSTVLSAEPEKRLLWPNGAPGARGKADADQPAVFISLPSKEKSTGTAVVVVPGGGYGGLAMGHEGYEIAQWLNQRGVAAFILRYRVAPYRHPIPLNDARRALRWARHHAKEFGVNAERVGIWGFSAGGHLSATVSTDREPADTQAVDPIDRLSSRPDFSILCYPVISFAAPHTHYGSQHNLLGRDASKELVESLSVEKRVSKQTPPTFLFHTTPDRAVPPENSIVYYLALRRAGVAAELHLYETGAHGVGLASKNPALASWPNCLEAWMRARGYLPFPLAH